MKQVYSFSKNSILSFLNYLTCAILAVSVYRLFIFRLNNTFLRIGAQKDEIVFLENYNYFKNHGWYQSLVDGCSPLFNLFTLPVNLFISDPVIAMRSLSLIAMLLIILVWAVFIRRYTKIPAEYKWASILFGANVVMFRGTYYSATDDPLFILFITISFLTLYIGVKNIKKANTFFIISGIFYACALSTRALFIFYLSGYLIILLLLIIKNKQFLKPTFLFGLSFLMLVAVIHYPSIIEKKSLSFHDKNFAQKNVTWPEINYLFLMRNKDRLLLGRNNKLKPTPEEVIEYKKQFGENALPKTYSESFLKLPFKMHVQNYIGLAYLQALPFIRQTGFLFPFFIIISIISIFRYKSKTSAWVPLIFYLAFVNSLCLTPLVHLEFRWFMLFSVLTSVFGMIYFFKYLSNYNFANYLLLINMIIIGLLNIFYIGLW